MNYKNKYYWSFRIEASRYYGEMESDSLVFITDENRAGSGDRYEVNPQSWTQHLLFICEEEH